MGDYLPCSPFIFRRISAFKNIIAKKVMNDVWIKKANFQKIPREIIYQFYIVSETKKDVFSCFTFCHSIVKIILRVGYSFIIPCHTHPGTQKLTHTRFTYQDTGAFEKEKSIIQGYKASSK